MADKQQKRLAYRVAYDGRDYHGFQRQPDVATIEDELLAACAALDVTVNAESPPPGYAAAGRTDAGVSALAQTIVFNGPSWVSPGALNAELPSEIRVWAVATPPEDFHPRYDAIEREYQYWQWADGMHLRRTRAAASRLIGTHDFQNFTTDSDDTIRTVTSISVVPDGPFLRLSVTSQGFLRGQVRRMVEAVAAIGRGDRPLSFIDRALESRPLTGADGIPPAPAAHLILTDVQYQDVHFETNPRAVANVASQFRGEHCRLSAESRVIGTIAGRLSMVSELDTE